jgi:hypothetical protein
MAKWELTAEQKKSAIEVQLWFKNGEIIRKTEGYRWGTFTCESDDRPDIDLVNKDNDYRVDDDFNDWELDELNDGCWTDWEFPATMAKEEQQRLIDLWNDQWYEGLEGEGWSQDECEFYFNGPMKLTNLDTGEEWSGSVDPAVVVHTIDLPTVIEPAVTEWFPATVNPVHKGIYECEMSVIDAWPFPNWKMLTWTGKAWKEDGNSIKETVKQWRGLTTNTNAN